MTLANEAKNEVVTMLRSKLTDVNSTNRVPSGSNWIYPDNPRINLSMHSYPRISVTEINRQSEIINIGITRVHQYEVWLEINIWVWSADNAPQIITISNVAYEGQKLLDYLIEDVINKLDDNQVEFDDDTNKLRDYSLVASSYMGSDKTKPHILRHRIEVKYKYFRG